MKSYFKNTTITKINFDRMKKIMTFALFMIDDVAQLQQWISVPKEIAIISHRNPDGDAVGSTMALAGVLEQLGHNVKVIYPSEYPVSFEYISGIHKASIFDLEHDKCRSIIDKAEMIFCLDFNGLDRVDKLGENIQNSKAKKVLVDHHLDPEPFTDLQFSDTSASSTSELIYKLIVDLGLKSRITPGIGECIFTGLITDTGSFKYGTRPYTYEVAGQLKSIGVDDYYIADKIYNTQNEKQLRLLGHSLANRMEVVDDYGYAMITLTKKDYQDFNIQRGDTEGIVNFLLSMPQIKVAIFITEQPTIVKISMRSKGDISVQEICQKYFSGGGHKNASGGGVYASLSDIVNRVKKVMPEYLKKK
jgi:phosphoesterase RecJ-like protein